MVWGKADFCVAIEEFQWTAEVSEAENRGIMEEFALEKAFKG